MEQVSETTPFQVFINHRGPDVKRTLASLIYHGLTNCGLSVFLDEKEIRTGDALSPVIFGAIQSASVHVVIFSERYAESSWCLKELCCILESSRKRNIKIIPLFCDVEPSELRFIKSGRYADAFKHHKDERRVDTKVLKEWETALEEASNISGLLFKTNEGDYGEIVNKIVAMVNEELIKRDALEVAKFPVGLNLAAEKFQNIILDHNDSNATRIVLLVGMPGVGKSTFVKHLYNLKRPYFSRSSILCEIRQTDPQSLQEQLLSDLLWYNNLPRIGSISQGKRILKDRIQRLPPIFVVLDDVDNMDQIENLLDLNTVASGSLILITSRDKDLLRLISSAKPVVYEVKPLNKKHARELFCLHAFSQSEPSEELNDLVEEFLKICGGLPLSLKVLGGLFVGRSDKGYWKQQLNKLSTTLPSDIINPLKVSYDALDSVVKEVFLDIGCFLVGEEKDLAIRVLEGLYDENTTADCLQCLHQKCLLDFSDRKREVNRLDGGEERRRTEERKYAMVEYNNTCKSITMHDQLREFARHIARQDFRRVFPEVFPTRNVPLRLSTSSDISIVSLLWQCEPRFQVRGIRSSSSNDFLYGIRGKGLRLFTFESEDSTSLERLFTSVATGVPRWDISGELVWLRIRSEVYPLYQCASSVSLVRLRVLEIKSSGTKVQEFFDLHRNDLPRHLTELNIECTERVNLMGSQAHVKAGKTDSSVLRYIENCVTGMVPWTRLALKAWKTDSSVLRYIENCVTGMRTLTRLALKYLGFLQSLPIDFSHLQNLRHLDLSGCCQLTELPNTFSELLQLQYLVLKDCSNLSIPFDILGEISTLEYVDFQGCAKLVSLPERIPNQRNLRYLNLLGTGLELLPDNLERLDELKQLAIGSPALKVISLTMPKLRGLRELFLVNCPSLQRILPEGIAAAPMLEILVIDSCPINNFSFQDQGNLDVENVHLIVGISFLRVFTLRNTLIKEICIPGDVFPRLEIIDLSENSRLMRVNALPSALVSLYLQNCPELEIVSSLSNLVNLKFLDINRCFNIGTLNMEGLASLEEINAEECWKLQRIEGLNQRERLNCLKISTDNEVIWHDICQFLTHHDPTTAIFSGRANDKKMFEGDIRRIAAKFNLPICCDILPGSKSSTFHLDSCGAILVCILTNHALPGYFTVYFPFSSVSDRLIYSIKHKGGRGVHVFLWTEKSDLFKEGKKYGAHKKMEIFFRSSKEGRSSGNEASSSNVAEERGWMVMVDKKTDVSEVCRELIRTCAI